MVRRPDRVARQWRTPAWAPIAAALVAGAALFVVVALVAGSDDGTPETSSSTSPTSSTPDPTTTTTAAPPPEPVPLDALTVEPVEVDVPTRFRIVYDIVENRLERREVWTIQRPYESLVLADRDDTLISGAATSRSQLWTYVSDREGWFGIQPELHRAAYDLRPLAVMNTMIELGLVEEAGTGEYAGRPCRVFRTAAPMSSGSVGVPSPGETTETCVDDRGMVLHERWEIDGELVSERTAASVEFDPPVDPTMFDPTPRIEDAPELDTLLSTVAVAADEETLARLRTDVVVPEGYVADGTVFRSSASDTGTDAASEIVRFYSAGPDLIEVAEVTAAGPAELDGGGARPVEIEGFDEVWFDPDFRVSVLRARIDESSFLELRGVTPARLVELLRTVTVR